MNGVTVREHGGKYFWVTPEGEQLLHLGMNECGSTKIFLYEDGYMAIEQGYILREVEATYEWPERLLTEVLPKEDKTKPWYRQFAARQK